MNADGINFQLYLVKNKWRKVMDHDEDTTLISVNCFEDFIVIGQRRGGLPEYRIKCGSCDDNTDDEHIITMPEGYDIWGNSNLEYDTNKFRFNYTLICYTNYNI